MNAPAGTTRKSDRLPPGQMHYIPIYRTLGMLKLD